MMISNDPTITIIIAAYNAQDSILRALDSVITDPYVTQIIVVDDCSTDATLTLIKEYQNQHSKVSVFSTEQNSGPSKARNIALTHCTTEWVTVLDADDYIEPGRFKKLLAYHQDYQLIADLQYRLLEGQPSTAKTQVLSEYFTFPHEISLSEFIHKNITKKGTSRQELGFIKPIIKRSFLLKHNLTYQENMRLGEDYELYCRCLALGAKLQLIEASGYVAVVRAHSLSSSHSTFDLIQLRDCDQLICNSLTVSHQERKLFQKHASSIDIKIQWRIFYTSLKQRRLVHSLAAMFSSYMAFPFIIKQLKHEFFKRMFNKGEIE